jgi:hypothetical protein
MMEKVRHRSQQKATDNAKQIKTTKKWSTSLCRDYLVDKMERRGINMEKNLPLLRCVGAEPGRWYVAVARAVIPDDFWDDLESDIDFHTLEQDATYENIRKSPITRFFHIREVKLVDGQYLACDCCYSRRNKAPCIHIIMVVGFRHPEMYGTRWLIHFQYYYQKTGGIGPTPELTQLFNQMLARDENREPLHQIPGDGNYPYLYEGTSPEDVEFMKNLMICQINDQLVERDGDGHPVWPENYVFTNYPELYNQQTMEDQDNDNEDNHLNIEGNSILIC